MRRLYRSGLHYISALLPLRVRAQREADCLRCLGGVFERTRPARSSAPSVPISPTIHSGDTISKNCR